MALIQQLVLNKVPKRLSSLDAHDLLHGHVQTSGGVHEGKVLDFGDAFVGVLEEKGLVLLGLVEGSDGDVI